MILSFWAFFFVFRSGGRSVESSGTFAFRSGIGLIPFFVEVDNTSHFLPFLRPVSFPDCSHFRIQRSVTPCSWAVSATDIHCSTLFFTFRFMFRLFRIPFRSSGTVPQFRNRSAKSAFSSGNHPVRNAFIPPFRNSPERSGTKIAATALRAGKTKPNSK